MITRIGHIHQIVRYPVKSMAGIAADWAFLGWHGLPGDRRFAFRRINDKSDFPWLTASKLPELLLYQPLELDANAAEPLPAKIRTPEGLIVPLGSAELDKSVSDKFGSPVELMRSRHGIFDEGIISVINLATMSFISREADQELDPRRFRANIVIASDSSKPFEEDSWIGRRLVFDGNGSGPTLTVTMRDLRCMMINLDPDTARQNPGMMKAAARLNENHAGVYASVTRTGEIYIGQSVGFINE